MADATAAVVEHATPGRSTAELEAVTAVEQIEHVNGCGICTAVCHALFFAAWRSGASGERAGGMASIVTRAFCAATNATAADKATPAELARAVDAAVDHYLRDHGAHVPDPAAFRLLVARTIAGALAAAGEVMISAAAGTTQH